MGGAAAGTGVWRAHPLPLGSRRPLAPTHSENSPQIQAAA